MAEVRLRLWRLEDADDVAVIVDDEQPGWVAVRPPEPASEAVRRDAVHEVDRPAAELSYWLVSEARGRGVACAAVRDDAFCCARHRPAISRAGHRGGQRRFRAT
jgi:RimJ/RimL family protein N-acetyltransferase